MTELKRVIYALASSPEVQVDLYPDFVCKGDELILDFDEAYARGESISSLSNSQRIEFEKLDKFIESHSGEQFQKLYTDQNQLFSNQFWKQVREMAIKCIEVMGWEYRVPLKSDAIYIRGASVVSKESK